MKRRFSWWLFLLVVWLAVDCATRQVTKRTPKLPAPAMVIAVLDFQNVAGDPELDYLVQTIPETLIMHLARSEELAIVERATLQQTLKALKLDRTGTVNDRTAAMVGRTVGANVVVTGSFVKIGTFVHVGNPIVVTIRLIDVQTLRLKFWEQVRGTPGVEIFGLIDEIAVRLLNYITPPQTQPPQGIDME